MMNNNIIISPNATRNYSTAASFPVTGQKGKLYLTEDTGEVYYWDGSSYNVIGASSNTFYGQLATDPVGTFSGGETYWNTVLNTMMTYDPSRSKWLSMSTITYGFSRNGTTAAGSYFNMSGGILMDPTKTGYPTFANAVLVGIQVTRADIDIVTIEIAADGVAIGEITLNAGIATGTVALNANITHPVILTARVKSGTNSITDCAGTFAIKLRV